MTINTSQIQQLLRPGLAEVFGDYPMYPAEYTEIFDIKTSDKAVEIEINRLHQNSSIEPTVIVLGAGFDTRAVRFLERPQPGNWVELDLPSVVRQKSLFASRLLKRRPHITLPSYEGVDLNDDSAVKSVLSSVLEGRCGAPVLFVFEAVILYLEQPYRPPALLKSCIDCALSNGAREVSFVFADRLPRVDGRAGDRAVRVGGDQGPLPAQDREC